ncbi:MAG: acyltransferase [Armatimonadetes bacterium]|nr:acyltransferase [Armatimonadota bacterium]
MLSILPVLFGHLVAPVSNVESPLNLALVGVWLFFVISGFLISTLLLREKRDFGRIDLLAFYVRRALRIFPLYFLILFLYIFLVPRFEPSLERQQEFWRQLPAFFTFTQNIVATPGVTNSIFYYSWSLAAEEQFYAFWPALAAFCRGRWVLSVLLVVGVVSYCTEIGLVDWPKYESLEWKLVVVGVTKPILFGVGLGYALMNQRVYEWLARFWRGWIPVFAILWVLGFLWLRGQQGAFYGKWTHPFIHVGLAALVWSCVVSPKGWLYGVLNSTTAKYIGTISYGLYMWNILSFNLVNTLAKDAPRPVISLLAFMVTFAIAGLSYRLFERPILQFKNRFQPSARLHRESH